MLSGKIPKKSHIFLLTEEQPRREIHLQQGSELQRDVAAEPQFTDPRRRVTCLAQGIFRSAG
ncbi:hypothetical protein, partial [Mesorhizobium sp. LNHC229A00]|uniref:hypothetical protein n=1 Tax=Mesorhizobium sp. LNHC229A00 TaxID=1287240 RepID=UPI001AEC2079